MPAANRAAGNVGEVLRGNEGAQRPTDLAKPNPEAAEWRRSVYNPVRRRLKLPFVAIFYFLMYFISQISFTKYFYFLFLFFIFHFSYIFLYIIIFFFIFYKYILLPIFIYYYNFLLCTSRERNHKYL